MVAPFTASGFVSGDKIKITSGRTAGVDLKRLCRRRFWYKPWTWFKWNYAIRKITKVTDHTIDLEVDLK